MFYPNEMIAPRKTSPIKRSLIPKKGAILLDVRSLPEYAAGHAQDAILIPIEDLGFFKEVIKGWRRPIMTCSSHGVRSKKAVARLRKAGIPAFDGGQWESWK